VSVRYHRGGPETRWRDAEIEAGRAKRSAARAGRGQRGLLLGKSFGRGVGS